MGLKDRPQKGAPAGLMTSKAMERASGYCGVMVRRLVRAGVIKPARDSSGRYLYTAKHVEILKKRKAEIAKRRAPYKD